MVVRIGGIVAAVAAAPTGAVRAAVVAAAAVGRAGRSVGGCSRSAASFRLLHQTTPLGAGVLEPNLNRQRERRVEK